MRRAVLLLALSIPPLFSQAMPLACTVTSVPNLVRINGAAESTGDVLLNCGGGSSGLSTFLNFTLFLNVDVTSKITNTSTNQSEGLLLIDEPHPGVSNSSNGCIYSGQTLGAPGIAACASGSGNVYTGTWGPDNVLTWSNIPFVEPGSAASRVIRLTNIRANANDINISAAPILAIVAISGASVTVNQPAGGTLVATMFDPLKFTAASPVGAVGVLDLTFAEQFDGAFRKRIENTPGGPLTAVLQDQPGTFYCTESGFTPQFSTTTPGDIGSANTGTRLVAEFTGLPPSVLFLIVPNEVTSSSGALVAHRVFPPFTSSFTGGLLPILPGASIVVVSAAHTAELLYEVTAAAPYQGVNGCATITSFTIPVAAFFPTTLAPAMVSGRLAPVDGTRKASSTALRPRFVP